jgi:hypothetical protein
MTHVGHRLCATAKVFSPYQSTYFSAGKRRTYLPNNVPPCLDRASLHALLGGLLSTREGRLRRRDFVSLLAAAAFARPGTASAQSSSKVFRLGALTPTAPRDEKTPLGRMLLKALDCTAIRSAKICRSRREAPGGSSADCPNLCAR